MPYAFCQRVGVPARALTNSPDHLEMRADAQTIDRPEDSLPCLALVQYLNSLSLPRLVDERPYESTI